MLHWLQRACATLGVISPKPVEHSFRIYTKHFPRTLNQCLDYTHARTDLAPTMTVKLRHVKGHFDPFPGNLIMLTCTAETHVLGI